MAGKPAQADIDALPAHQRPTMHEMGRRSEHAEHPFKAMPPDEGAPGYAAALPPRTTKSWARPTIAIERVGQRDVVSAACPVALKLGLTPGMAAAHARALVTDLDVHDADPAADQALLDRLALHAVRHWTPIASVAPPDGLWLDLTGSTHLFGGEQRFCRRLLRFFARLGFTAAIAIAGTPGAAYALARYSGDAITILSPGSETQAIADLPLVSLRLAPDALTAASRFGLERVADLYPMPRGPLARRLGTLTVTRLDQARGLTCEPIVPIVPVEDPHVELKLLEPIATAEAITVVISDLVDDMVTMLEARGLGARVIVLTCLRVDGHVQRIRIGTAGATRDASHLKRMLGLRVEQVEPGLGIETISLRAPRTEPLTFSTIDSLNDGRSSYKMLLLLDQLAGRVGEKALFRVSSNESDVPERAIKRIGATEPPVGWPSWPRPIRLLRPPEPLLNVAVLMSDYPPRRFVWRGRTYRVVQGDGPERIHGEWWRSPGEMWAVRDYFRVETEGGERLWVFRRGDGVETSTGDLSWYIHGLFG